jgi:hypothetical protein
VRQGVQVEVLLGRLEAQEVRVALAQVQVLAYLVLVQQEGVLMEVQEQVLPLLEQEALPLEAHRLNPQGQGLPQEVQVQQEEVLLQGQEALLVLEQAQGQVQLLEALVRAQAGVLAQVEAEVLELALAVGLERVALAPQARVQEEE